MKISVLLPLHRWGGIDLIFETFEHQTLPKDQWELIICDKLYKYRKDAIKVWSEEHDINVIHFEPKNKSDYHVHSSVLNECLQRANNEISLVIGDYTYAEPNWLEIHKAYNEAGYCLSAPQMIYSLPRLKNNLERPISVFDQPFHPEIFKIIPPIAGLDPKLSAQPGSIIDFRYWHNRNESFPTEKARQIGGWDKRYDNSVGPSNLEFGLRMQYEAGCKIATDSRAKIHRILSYAIPPHVKFITKETNDNVNQKLFTELLTKYGLSKL